MKAQTTPATLHHSIVVPGSTCQPLPCSPCNPLRARPGGTWFYSATLRAELSENKDQTPALLAPKSPFLIKTRHSLTEPCCEWERAPSAPTLLQTPTPPGFTAGHRPSLIATRQTPIPQLAENKAKLTTSYSIHETISNAPKSLKTLIRTPLLIDTKRAFCVLSPPRRALSGRSLYPAAHPPHAGRTTSPLLRPAASPLPSQACPG